MRFALVALAALLLAGCVWVPMPFVVAVPATPAPVGTLTPSVAMGETPVVEVASSEPIYLVDLPHYPTENLGTAAPGELLPVLGRTDDNEWIQVDYHGTPAWARVDNVRPVNPEAFGPGGSAIPVTAPARPTPTPPWLTAP